MEYIAVYEVLRNDKILAEVTIQLSQEDDTWTLHGFTHDTRGLADILNVKGVQTATGQWQGGRFMPEKYDFSFKLVGYKTSWHAEFDWTSRVVTTRSKSGKKQLPLASGAVDPFSLFLNISSYLSEKQPQVAVDVVDEDEIENHVYRVDLEAPVQTALGCLATTRVKRIRENSKRTSMAWYANDYNYIPVQLQHFKKKGKGLGMRIISLDVAGLAIQPVASCENDDSGSHRANMG